MKKVSPDEVGAGIVEALEHPRFDVFVPKSIGPIGQVVGLLPRRGREGVARALKADKVLSGADLGARRAYELRRIAVGARPGGGRRAGPDPREVGLLT